MHFQEYMSQHASMLLSGATFLLLCALHLLLVYSRSKVADILVFNAAGCAKAQASIAALAVSPTLIKTAVQTTFSPNAAYYCIGDADIPITVKAMDVSTETA